MDSGHWILIITTFSGFIFGIWQLFLKRKHEKEDKIQERRYESYRRLMYKLEEVNQNLRMDIDNPFNLALQLDSLSHEIIMKRLNDFIKKPTDALTILENEIESVKLDCSPLIFDKLIELKKVVRKTNDFLSSNLYLINSDPAKLFAEVGKLLYDKDIMKLKPLNDEIVLQMRKEIGTNK